MYDAECRFCGRQAKHRHHKVEKGRGCPKKFAYMDHIHNFEYVCRECHHDTHAHPHKGKDLEMKIEVYQMLQKIFFKPYYNSYVIQKLLKYRPEQLRGLLKSLTPVGDSYKREDIILKLMGGSIHPNILEEVGEI